jgi:hypothetical protein
MPFRSKSSAAKRPGLRAVSRPLRVVLVDGRQPQRPDSADAGRSGVGGGSVSGVVLLCEDRLPGKPESSLKRSFEFG